MSADDYRDHALAALPFWFSREARALENVEAFGEIFQTVEDQTTFWKNMSYILLSQSSPTNWLGQHGRDRNAPRQSIETDAEYRTRIRLPENAIVLPAVQSAVNSALASVGYVDTVFLYALRSERAFFGDKLDDTGTGGDIEPAGMELTGVTYLPRVGDQVVIAGSGSGNNGTYDITGFSGNRIVVTPAPVSEPSFPGTWTISRFDNNSVYVGDRANAYFSSGTDANQYAFRMGSNRPILVFLFPSGCKPSGTGGTIASVSGNTYSFAPTVPLTYFPRINDTFTLSGATTPSNDGTYTITNIVGGALYFENVGTVPEAFPGTWSVETSVLVDLITEVLRDKAGAGVLNIVECKE